MKKSLVAIFAHPDDEAFGPSGTLAIFAQTHDVHIICATRGEAGQNNQPQKKENLGKIREKELLEAAKVISAKQVHFLDFIDGTLSNQLYHDLAKEIRKKTDIIKPEIFLTYEPRGISGHIDHITISMVTSFVFEKVDYAKELLYFCISDEQRNLMTDDYFIYRPPGYHKSQIDKIIDIAPVWDKKRQAIKKHASQIKDAERILARLEKFPKEEYFLVRKK